MRELRTRTEVDEALAGTGVIFKHSTRCPVSSDAYDQVARFALRRPEVPLAILDVVAARALSAHLAAVTGITHQSPQLLVVEDGRVVWHASHYGITTVAIERHVG